MLACISLDTVSSPDGAVLFVLSMYIGLNQKIVISLYIKLELICMSLPNASEGELYCFITLFYCLHELLKFCGF